MDDILEQIQIPWTHACGRRQATSLTISKRGAWQQTWGLNLKEHIKNQQVINLIQPDYDKSPLAIFLLGSNGSGKTTLRRYLNLSEIQTNIDPDALNRIFKLKYPKNYQIESARNALSMYTNALDNNYNVCMESTLAGHGTMRRIIEAKNKGYYTLVYFVGLESVELNIERIAFRVANGGHYITDDVVRKRYVESINNLQSVYSYFDELYVLDNSKTFYNQQFSLIKGYDMQICDNMEAWASTLLQNML